MAVTINRGPWNALVDDSGAGLDGSPWDKAAIKTVLLDPIDGALAAVGSSTGMAPINSPVFTGDPQAPTPAPGDNDTSIATTAYVQAAVKAGVISATGVWTPFVQGDGGGTAAYGARSGSYLRIGGPPGGLYVATFSLQLSSKGSLAGNVILGGWPAGHATAAPAWCLIGWDLVPTVVNLALQVAFGQVNAYARPVFASAAGPWINNGLLVSSLSDTTQFFGTLIYPAP